MAREWEVEILRSDAIKSAVGKIPCDADLEQFVIDFMGGAGTVGKAPSGMFLITLPGKPSHPLRTLNPELAKEPLAVLEEGEERWIEVKLLPEEDALFTVMVTTRYQDAFTVAIAGKLATVIAKMWGGKATRLD